MWTLSYDSALLISACVFWVRLLVWASADSKSASFESLHQFQHGVQQVGARPQHHHVIRHQSQVHCRRKGGRRVSHLSDRSPHIYCCTKPTPCYNKLHTWPKLHVFYHSLQIPVQLQRVVVGALTRTQEGRTGHLSFKDRQRSYETDFFFFSPKKETMAVSALSSQVAYGNVS